jgi:hypothetical protein
MDRSTGGELPISGWIGWDELAALAKKLDKAYGRRLIDSVYP